MPNARSLRAFACHPDDVPERDRNSEEQRHEQEPGRRAEEAVENPPHQRAAGQVGEQPDGYLGVVGSGTPALRSMVSDINIRRKAAYTRGAQENGSTVEQFAFVSGCRLILRTEAGEKYQAPDGTWMTRGSSPPVRDPRCI